MPDHTLCIKQINIIMSEGEQSLFGSFTGTLIIKVQLNMISP
jgi:hypothetical protein